MISDRHCAHYLLWCRIQREDDRCATCKAACVTCLTKRNNPSAKRLGPNESWPIRTMESPDWSFPWGRSAIKKKLTDFAVGVVFSLWVSAPDLYIAFTAPEKRTCAEVAKSYPDRVCCRAVKAGFMWKVGGRTSLYVNEGYTPPKEPLRCDEDGLVGEIPAYQGKFDNVLAKGSYILSGGTKLDGDPTSGIYEATCLKIPKFAWQTRLRLR